MGLFISMFLLLSVYLVTVCFVILLSLRRDYDVTNTGVCCDFRLDLKYLFDTSENLFFTQLQNKT